MEVTTPVVKKRASKTKPVLIAQPSLEVTTEIIEESKDADEKKILKRRGRKPKGGKIVQIQPTTNPVIIDKPNILIHLKCSMQDLETLQSDNIGTFQFHTNVANDFLQLHQNQSEPQATAPHYNDNYFLIHSQYTDAIPNDNDNLFQPYTFTKNTCKPTIGTNSVSNNTNSSIAPQCKCEYNSHMSKKLLLKKLNDLSVNLHKNTVDKKSACFWCTYNFDTPVIYIPKYSIHDQYYVYGCFCSPECAFAYLMNESIDTATKFERYQLLNYIYKSLYMYTNNIKPAPNPYYMLDKYYGNLTIQEYRSLFQTDRLFLIVDKPLTKMMPEMVEDNDEFILNKKLIPSGNYQIKRGSTKKNENKRDIITENFGY